ncbi:MAG: hypothetical protein QM723_21800 [Myxococcaceae bacterium]
MRVDPLTLTTRWLPVGAEGITYSGKLPRSEREFAFRIKRTKDGCKLLGGGRVLLDGEEVGDGALNGGEVISYLRPEMPVHLFLAGTPARNSELEQRLTESDRDEDWLVYADWLQQEHDPMGQALMRAHAFRLGCARPNFLMRRSLHVEWRFCFWRGVHLDIERRARDLGDTQLLLALLAFPQARLLRSLKVNLAALTDNSELAERYAQALVDEVLPSSIEHLELGPVFPEISRVEMYRRFPRWDGQPIHGMHRQRWQYSRYPCA